jgi:hypothetical protein
MLKHIFSNSQKYATGIQYFICLSSWMTNDVKRTRGSKSSVAMAKAAFSKKKIYSPANWISI